VPSAGDEVLFDASDSSDDGDVVSYLWEIDGTKLEGERIAYVFETAGSYDVTLWVTDDRGEADTRSVVVKVTQGTAPEPPPEDPPVEDEDPPRR
jgi:PKD repeat protein